MRWNRDDRSLSIAIFVLACVPFFVSQFTFGLFLEADPDEAESLLKDIFLDFKGHLVAAGILNHHLSFRLTYLAFKWWGIGDWRDAMVHLEVARLVPISLFFITFALLYRLAVRYFTWEAGVVAAVILASTPLIMNQAPQIRSYSGSLMLMTLLIHTFLSHCEQPRLLKAVLIALWSGLSIYSLIFNAYFILSLGLLTLVLHGLRDRSTGGVMSWIDHFFQAWKPWRWDDTWLAG
ncbi:MAG: glycosyltransferase family 39 protein, partial [Magnetococcales bacterium]|nr:glycosyltransferase family 39 protein [Magnetococcales bacterium]